MSGSDNPFLSWLRRYPFCATCLLVAIGLGACAWILRGRVIGLEELHRERAEESETMIKLLLGGATQRQELALVRETVRRIEDNLLIETDLAENHWYFFKLEEQTKAKLVEVHQLSSPVNEASPMFKRIPYSVRVAGTYEQIGFFLLALETGPRLVNVVGFRLARQGAGDTLALDLNLELLGKK